MCNETDFLVGYWSLHPVTDFALLFTVLIFLWP